MTRSSKAKGSLYRQRLQRRPDPQPPPGERWQPSKAEPGSGRCAFWPNSLKITQLFVCGYEYEFSVDAQHAYVCVCVCQCYPLFVLIPPTPSPPQDRDAGMGQALNLLLSCSLIVGSSPGLGMCSCVRRHRCAVTSASLPAARLL